ncbi:Hypothetical protein A7982_04507 [Minicystis rosea]|nr:Hypothetical protein A7982_04507 [Minicystis rosea]
MGKVTALFLDTITDKSGHVQTGLAVSVCLTPAAPAPLPIPYPTFGSVMEGITDPCMRTKIEGAKILTVGGCMSKCHGNEPGTLKEIVSLNTCGPCFPWLGAPIVFIELGMAGITGAMGQMNKSITVGAGAKASGAGGTGSGGGGAGGGAGGPGQGGPGGGSNGGGGGGGSNSGAAPPNAPAAPGAEGQQSAGHPVDVITGAMFTNPELDFMLPGFLPLRFARGYTSSAVRKSCGMGFGWAHDLHYRAHVRGDRMVLVDPSLRETTAAFPGEDEVVLLPYGRRISRVGHALSLTLDDGFARILLRRQGTNDYHLAELRDTFGNSIELFWEGDELVGIIDSVGRRAALVREGRFLIWELTVVSGDGSPHRSRLVTYEIDDRGDLVSVLDAGGVQTRYEYDDQHYLVAEHQPNGVTFRFVYADVDGQRRCVETWGEITGRDVLAELGGYASGARGIFHAQLTYGPGPYETTMTDAAGGTHRYRGNALGLVEEYVDPRGYVTQHRYDAQGNLLSVCDGDGGITRRRYDAFGRFDGIVLRDGARTAVHRDEETGTITMVEADGSRRGYRFNGVRVVEKVDAAGRRTKFEYDERGQVAAVSLPDGTRDVRTYDAHGNIRSRVTATGQRYEYVFDLLGRPVSMTSPIGVEYELDYDSRGDVVAIREPEGRTTTHRISPTHRVEAVRDPGGGTTTYRYVADALVEARAADGSTYKLGYDALLRLIWMENPAGERYLRAYDAAGNVTRETSFAGVTTTYEHDGGNEVVRVEHADGSWVRVERDGEGRVTRREHASGLIEELQYDVMGSLVRAKSGASEITFERDVEGRVLCETQVCGGFRFAVTYRYDDRGAIVERRYSTGWGVAFDRKPGILASVRVTSGEAEAPALAFTQDERGLDVGYAFGAARLAVERDRYGLPTKVTLAGEDGAPTRERAFVWSRLGPLAAVEDSRSGGRRYDLDDLGRPVGARGLGADESFQFAPQGTAIPEGGSWRLGRDGRPVQTDTAMLTWDRLGRLAARAGDDPARSFTYAYQHNNQLAEVVRGDGARVRYLYDALGRRICEVTDAGSTWFGWDGESAVEEIHTGGRRVQRVFDDTGYTPLLEAQDDAGFRLVATDAAGTPYLFVGADGEAIGEQDLTTWGALARRDGVASSLRFAGQRADAMTGLHYNRYRYYAPDLHVFTTPDPLGLVGSLQDVGYVRNPTLYIDPLGLTTIVVGGPDDKVINQHLTTIQQQYPGARVIHCDRLQPGDLAGENHVVVTTHGAPGIVEWGREKRFLGIPYRSRPVIDGPQLGDKLKNAGFAGGPGSKVDMYACNAATPPKGAGPSVTAGVAAQTGSTAYGARSDQPDRTHRGESDDLSGKKWYQFWRKPNNWPPGGMCPVDPKYNPPVYVHNGSWTSTDASGTETTLHTFK